MFPILKHADVPTASELAHSTGRNIVSVIRTFLLFVVYPWVSFVLSFRLIRAVADFVIITSRFTYNDYATIYSELIDFGQILRDIFRSLYSILDSSVLKTPGSLISLGFRCLPFDDVTTYRVCVASAFLDTLVAHIHDIFMMPSWDELLVISLLLLASSTFVHNVIVTAFKDIVGITGLQRDNALQRVKIEEYKKLIRQSQEVHVLLTDTHVEGDYLVSELRCAEAQRNHEDVTKRSLIVQQQERETALSRAQACLQDLRRCAEDAENAAFHSETGLREAIRGRIERLQRLLAEFLETQLQVQRVSVLQAEGSTEARRVSTDRLNAQLHEHDRITKVYEAKITSLQADASLAYAAIAETKGSTVAAEQTCRVALTEAHNRLSTSAAQCDEKDARVQKLKARNEAQCTVNAALSETLSALRSKLAQTQGSAQSGFSRLALYTAKDRLTVIDGATALVEHKSQLLAALRDVKQQTTGLDATLSSSIVEHRMHMNHCNAERAALTSRLASLQSALARIHETRDRLSAEVTPLRAQRAEMAAEQEAQKAELEARLKLVSQGFAGAEKARKDVEKELDKTQRELKQDRHRHRLAVGAYQRSRDVGNAFTDSLIQTADEKKTCIAQLEADISELEARKAAADDARLTLPLLVEQTEKVQDELADKYEALTEHELLVRRLQEDLCELQGTESELEAERQHGARVFTKEWAKARRENEALRRRLVEQRLFHRGRLAGFEGRLESAACALAAVSFNASREKVGTQGEDVEEAFGVSEFVQGSSWDGTPEQDGDSLRGGDSCPSTPSLANTSRSWSHSPSNSPDVAAVVFVALSEELDGAVTKPPDI